MPIPGYMPSPISRGRSSRSGRIQRGRNIRGVGFRNVVRQTPSVSRSGQDFGGPLPAPQPAPFIDPEDEAAMANEDAVELNMLDLERENMIDFAKGAAPLVLVGALFIGGVSLYWWSGR